MQVFYHVYVRHLFKKGPLSYCMCVKVNIEKMLRPVEPC